jgi:predicted esterase YcpF (UPF0227 family)
VLLYLHGFRSSPRSFKARLLAEHFARLGRPEQFLCPQLPASPADSAKLLLEWVGPLDVRELCLVGSSLGGYYATWLAQTTGCRAVLLNPAVRPQRDLAAHLGRQRVYYSEQTIDVTAQHLLELDALWIEPLTRLERYFLIAAKGDEVLDWREMAARYDGARQWLIEGGDHGLSGFADMIDTVLEYAR